MNMYKINIRPLGSFYSLIKGDMLFGTFCRTLSDSFGKDRLKQCLNGYTQGNPFTIFSDAFPSDYLPKPTLPFTYYAKNNGEEDKNPIKNRKENKRKKWIPTDKITLSSAEMSSFFEENNYFSKVLRTSVHLDPKTHHTTGGKYSAYTAEQFIYSDELTLTVYVLIDEARITTAEVQSLIKKIGQVGYGRKASSGYGKFDIVNDLQKVDFSAAASDSYLTLAPCVPQLDIFDKDKSFYHIFVRFGRHGGTAAISENPFKKPVMTADTGAVFTLKSTQNADKYLKFIGTGITAVSQAEPDTVFQGYAPVIPLNLTEVKDDRE